MGEREKRDKDNKKDGNPKKNQVDFFFRKKTIALTVTAIVGFSLVVAVITGNRILQNEKELPGRTADSGRENEGIGLDLTVKSEEDGPNGEEEGNDQRQESQGADEMLQEAQQGAQRDDNSSYTEQGPADTEEQKNPDMAESGIIGEAAAFTDPDIEPFTGMKFTPVSDTVMPYETVNIRTLPTRQVESDIVCVLTNGETVERTGINEETGWSRVLFQGKVCYAFSEYLTTDLYYQAEVPVGTDENSVEIRTQFAMVDEMVTPKIEVNLRRLPSVTDPRAEVAATIYAGEVVHRTGINEDLGWSRVEYHGMTLYCISSYVEPSAERSE